MIQSKARISNNEVKRIAPEINAAISALGATARGAGLPESLLELLFLRASQINGCAYCVQYHITTMRALGVSPEKIDLLVAWREAGIFTEREKAALAWTEALTLVAETRVPDETYEVARGHFSERELACLTAAVCTINCWNRLSVAFRFDPEFEN